jgi:probable addiction module antidote protein
MKRGNDLPAMPQDEWLIDQLRDAELSVAYLNAALAEGDQAAFMLALRNVAKARGGVAAMARETGLNRVALSRALTESGNPELRSLIKMLDASGLQLVVVSKARSSRLRQPHRRQKKTAARDRARRSV